MSFYIWRVICCVINSNGFVSAINDHQGQGDKLNQHKALWIYMYFKPEYTFHAWLSMLTVQTDSNLGPGHFKQHRTPSITDNGPILFSFISRLIYFAVNGNSLDFAV
jgi:hypothetical protein